MEAQKASDKKFEIVNGKWIKHIEVIDKDETVAIKIDSIKVIKCYWRSAGFLSKDEIDKFYILLEVSGRTEIRFTYEKNQRAEYLRDKKTLEDLLFNR